VFLTSVTDGGERSISRPGHFTPGEETPVTHWVRRRAGLEAVAK